VRSGRRKERLGIEQYAISLTTLEEVFMKIAELGSADHSLAAHVPELAGADAVAAASAAAGGGNGISVTGGTAAPVVSSTTQSLPTYGVAAATGRTPSDGDGCSQFCRHFTALYRKRSQYGET
jgi:hypothetical protein